MSTFKWDIVVQLQLGQQPTKHYRVITIIHHFRYIYFLQQLFNSNLSLVFTLHCHLKIQILDRSAFISTFQLHKTTFHIW